MVYQQKVQILNNRQIHGKYYQLCLKCENGFEKAMPGQFVMIRLTDNYSPMLRRPFSIHNVFQNENGDCCFELLYKVVGQGTLLLSECLENQWLDILGPIGNGFRIKESLSSALLISGGIGIAPMLFLAKFLLKNRIKCHLINGGRTEKDILCTERFQSKGIDVSIYTDDGSFGVQGFVTDDLETMIDSKVPDILYACGPQPMLAKVSEIATKKKVSCQISLESHMACGMGACLGCAVPSENGQKSYYHVCADGPVFSSDRVNIRTYLE